MSTRKRKLKSVARRVARDPKRSPLFHWLLENYAELEPATAGARSDWAPLKAEAIENGITDDAGNEPSERTVRETMRKVRREMARQRAAERCEATPEAQPSRLPAAWQPPRMEPTRAPPAPRAVPPRCTTSPPVAEEDLPADVKAKLAALDAQLDWRDRFVRPPKRKE